MKITGVKIQAHCLVRKPGSGVAQLYLNPTRQIDNHMLMPLSHHKKILVISLYAILCVILAKFTLSSLGGPAPLESIKLINSLIGVNESWSKWGGLFYLESFFLFSYPLEVHFGSLFSR